MRSLLGWRAIAFAFVCLLTCGQVCRGEDTVFFVVRHAEKLNDTGDTPLSPEGMKRAEQLAQTLEHLRVDAIYYTVLRAEQTAQPLATKRGIVMKKYTDPTPTWIDDLLTAQRGKRTLIVGHSNTVHLIVRRLTGQTISEIGEHYDNLFIVVISDSGNSITRLKYGEAH